ncbi:MAG: GIY-YIG nuclease family protein, partial [Desulfobacterales bacterium]|jgi:DNA polymerase-3 subunit epsilon
MVAAMTTRLADLEILALDCQATGNHPANGHLLEMGWSRFRALDHQCPASADITSCLMRLPADIEIPTRISRITGICQDDQLASVRPRVVWAALVEDARKVAANRREKICPMVVHYSRFEEPFLKELHRQFGVTSAFPFDIVCSHEIARRLFPGLPRRGIRAIAGYFGHAVPGLKRCRAHVAATVVIWRNLVTWLADKNNVFTLEDLRDWLRKTHVPPRPARVYPMKYDVRLNLPNKPGIYRMLRHNGDVLYIGKARSLRQRVNSYFQKGIHHAEHILEMLSQAGDLQITLTHSALEAAVLECDQIKRYSPPYNIALRKRDRNLWFCSRDFRTRALSADECHRHGPLPSKEPLVSLSAILELIQNDRIDTGKIEASAAAVAIGIPGACAPPVEVFQTGLQLFCHKHRRFLKHKPAWRALMPMGTRLWRESLNGVETATATEGDCGVDESQAESNQISQEREWTPESVSRALESIIRRCAHWIRRSRWFCLLSESTLAWEMQARPGVKTILVFSKGVTVDRRVTTAATVLPVPPGCETDFRTRQQNFDLKTYDRLRVVTTELRRLISENRQVELRVGSKPILRPADLSKALRWI